MKRVFGIFAFLLLTGAALYGVYKWDTQIRFYRLCLWTKTHYMLHKEAFEKLGQAFSEDPPIDSVVYIPPGADMTLLPAHPYKFANRDDQASHNNHLRMLEEQQFRYAPLLAALKFPGHVTFRKSESNSEFMIMRGGGEYSDFMISYELIHSRSRSSLPPRCPKKPTKLVKGDCAIEIGNEWWLRYQWAQSPLT